MVRQLSNLLTDTSLAFGASESLEEMLQLVVEQARESTIAAACLASAALPGGRPYIRAVSYAEPASGSWSTLLESDLLLDVYSRIGSAPAGTRMSGEQLRQQLHASVVRASLGEQELPGWLAAPLMALDGSEFGSIHVLDKSEGDFSELDEAVLVHLAQMAAAALERARLYQRP